MKNLTTIQIANKIANSKSDATKAKYSIYAMDNFTKEEFISITAMVCEISVSNRQSRQEGTYTDSMFL